MAAATRSIDVMARAASLYTSRTAASNYMENKAEFIARHISAYHSNKSPQDLASASIGTEVHAATEKALRYIEKQLSSITVSDEQGLNIKKNTVLKKAKELAERELNLVSLLSDNQKAKHTKFMDQLIDDHGTEMFSNSSKARFIEEQIDKTIDGHVVGGRTDFMHLMKDKNNKNVLRIIDWKDWGDFKFTNFDDLFSKKGIPKVFDDQMFKIYPVAAADNYDRLLQKGNLSPEEITDLKNLDMVTMELDINASAIEALTKIENTADKAKQNIKNSELAKVLESEDGFTLNPQTLKELGASTGKIHKKGEVLRINIAYTTQQINNQIHKRVSRDLKTKELFQNRIDNMMLSGNKSELNYFVRNTMRSAGCDANSSACSICLIRNICPNRKDFKSSIYEEIDHTGKRFDPDAPYNDLRARTPEEVKTKLKKLSDRLEHNLTEELKEEFDTIEGIEGRLTDKQQRAYDAKKLLKVTGNQVLLKEYESNLTNKITKAKFAFNMFDEAFARNSGMFDQRFIRDTKNLINDRIYELSQLPDFSKLGSWQTDILEELGTSQSLYEGLFKAETKNTIAQLKNVGQELTDKHIHTTMQNGRVTIQTNTIETLQQHIDESILKRYPQVASKYQELAEIKVAGQESLVDNITKHLPGWQSTEDILKGFHKGRFKSSLINSLKMTANKARMPFLAMGAAHTLTYLAGKLQYQNQQKRNYEKAERIQSMDEKIAGTSHMAALSMANRLVNSDFGSKTLLAKGMSLALSRFFTLGGKKTLNQLTSAVTEATVKSKLTQPLPEIAKNFTAPKSLFLGTALAVGTSTTLLSRVRTAPDIEDINKRKRELHEHRYQSPNGKRFFNPSSDSRSEQKLHLPFGSPVNSEFFTQEFTEPIPKIADEIISEFSSVNADRSSSFRHVHRNAEYQDAGIIADQSLYNISSVKRSLELGSTFNKLADNLNPHQGPKRQDAFEDVYALRGTLDAEQTKRIIGKVFEQLPTAPLIKSKDLVAPSIFTSNVGDRNIAGRDPILSEPGHNAQDQDTSMHYTSEYTRSLYPTYNSIISKKNEINSNNLIKKLDVSRTISMLGNESKNRFDSGHTTIRPTNRVETSFDRSVADREITVDFEQIWRTDWSKQRYPSTSPLGCSSFVACLKK